MTKYVHIVYVHPVENGLPNLHKVLYEFEFLTKELAVEYINSVNRPLAVMGEKAVYHGRVNYATGELE